MSQGLLVCSSRLGWAEPFAMLNEVLSCALVNQQVRMAGRAHQLLRAIKHLQLLDHILCSIGAVVVYHNDLKFKRPADNQTGRK